MMEEERTLSALSNLLAVSPSHSDQSVGHAASIRTCPAPLLSKIEVEAKSQVQC